MRLNILVAASSLVTIAAGLVIPANTLFSRDLEIRDGLVEDNVNIAVRQIAPQVEYKIPHGVDGKLGKSSGLVAWIE
jgi:hypothetical protein